MTWLARLYLEEGVIEMRSDWTWHALPDGSGEIPDMAARTAAMLTQSSLYARTQYSPAHGYPGHQFARAIGEKWHADRIELCPILPSPPGVVH